MAVFHTQTLCSRRVRRALRRLGCVEYRYGNHTIYQTSWGRKFSVPAGHRETSMRALRHALETVGIPWDDFLSHY